MATEYIYKLLNYGTGRSKFVSIEAENPHDAWRMLPKKARLSAWDYYYLHNSKRIED